MDQLGKLCLILYLLLCLLVFLWTTHLREVALKARCVSDTVPTQDCPLPALPTLTERNFQNLLTSEGSTETLDSATCGFIGRHG